jgi:hypothetical protein
MRIFLEGNPREVQRVSNLIHQCILQFPELLSDYYTILLSLLQNPQTNDAHMRNIVRLLQFVTIPSDYEALALEACFSLLENPQKAIAIRVFSMTVIFNIARKYPEIRQELGTLLTFLLQEKQSAGFENRARKLLSKI